jgi:hypothetical protein
MRESSWTVCYLKWLRWSGEIPGEAVLSLCSSLEEMVSQRAGWSCDLAVTSNGNASTRLHVSDQIRAKEPGRTRAEDFRSVPPQRRQTAQQVCRRLPTELRMQ